MSHHDPFRPDIPGDRPEDRPDDRPDSDDPRATPSDRDRIDDRIDDPIDDLGRSAGAALRRPAPVGGFARATRSARRRRVATAAGGVAALALVVGGAVVVIAGRGDDGTIGGVADSTVVTVPDETTDPTAPSNPTVVTGATTAPTNDVDATDATPDSTPDTTPDSTPDTTPASTPGSEPGTGWAPLDAELPSQMATNRGDGNPHGSPSPPLSADLAQPVAPGYYALGGEYGAPTTITDGVLTATMYAFAPCAADNVDEVDCNRIADVGGDALGVETASARPIEIRLDESVRVVVQSSTCEADVGAGGLITPVVAAGSGADLLAWSTGFDEAYARTIRPPLSAGTGILDLVSQIGAEPTDGFAAESCTGAAVLWLPESAPPVWMSLDDLSDEFGPQPDDTGTEAYVTSIGLSVGQEGTVTLYLFAGFVS